MWTENAISEILHSRPDVQITFVVTWDIQSLVAELEKVDVAERKSFVDRELERGKQRRNSWLRSYSSIDVNDLAGSPSVVITASGEEWSSIQSSNSPLDESNVVVAENGRVYAN